LIHIKYYLNDNWECCTDCLVTHRPKHEYQSCESGSSLLSSVKHIIMSYRISSFILNFSGDKMNPIFENSLSTVASAIVLQQQLSQVYTVKSEALS
jgi:hypothetical protein